MTKLVVVTEHLVVVEALQRCACRQRLGAGAVDGAPRGGRAGVATTRRTIDRLAALVEDLEGGRRRPRLRKGIVFQAQCVEQRIARSTAAADCSGPSNGRSWSSGRLARRAPLRSWWSAAKCKSRDSRW